MKQFKNTISTFPTEINRPCLIYLDANQIMSQRKSSKRKREKYIFKNFKDIFKFYFKMKQNNV